jgi:ABC-type amino acid transport substrate-binding protein
MNKSELNTGAGKGDDPRPVNRKKFNETLNKMKKHGIQGTLLQKKGARSIYIYK